jgi:hypothetical protein
MGSGRKWFCFEKLSISEQRKERRKERRVGRATILLAPFCQPRPTDDHRPSSTFGKEGKRGEILFRSCFYKLLQAGVCNRSTYFVMGPSPLGSLIYGYKYYSFDLH